MEYLLQEGDNHYENGLHHGRTFKDHIKELAKERWQIMKADYLPKSTDEYITRFALEEVETLKKYSDLYDEFRGICDGADVSPAALAVLNNYTDMRNLPDDGGGCTSLYCRNEHGTSAGQTWDMGEHALNHTLHLEIKRGDYHAHVLTVTGCLGLSGTNGLVAIGVNDLKTTETDNKGLIWPVLVRCLLMQDNSKNAAEFLKNNMPVSGHHYLIGDQNEIYGMETTGKRYWNTAEGNPPFYAHANHYLSPLGDSSVDKELKQSTKMRQELGDSFFKLEPNQHLTTKEVADKIFGVPLGKGGVCLLKSSGYGVAITCGGFIFNFNDKKGFIFSAEYTDLKPIFIEKTLAHSLI